MPIVNCNRNGELYSLASQACTLKRPKITAYTRFPLYPSPPINTPDRHPISENTPINHIAGTGVATLPSPTSHTSDLISTKLV
ncbi:hypothetical protein L1987_58987 [Smallanthus sonchifolius]|uniref:Uncharacterized protein n=1 Tax=Smallanthus sonchifolius TaxID=185202 RepID=A0ACB9D468_9ASTR|nr:hypothetical protein L1987_58987 [Smallanthus sonchifolius]